MSKILKTKASNKTGLTGGVHISACLERSGEIPQTAARRYGSQCAQKIFVDEDGNVAARAFCGSKGYVCSRAEVPQLVDFLSKLTTVKPAKVA